MQAALQAVDDAEDELTAQPLTPTSTPGHAQLVQTLQPVLRATAALAPLLREHWSQPEQMAADRLPAAQAAAARSCAYLRCTNLGGEGGPAAGEGVGSQRCR